MEELFVLPKEVFQNCGLGVSVFSDFGRTVTTTTMYHSRTKILIFSARHFCLFHIFV
jgi:hypothetical protein